MISIEKIDVSIENRILGHLITSTSLLGRVRKILDPTLFESTLSRIVGSWVVDYYDRTGDAPGKTITDIYIERCHELQSADAQMVQSYLQNCSDNWRPTNLEYSVEMAQKYFQERSLRRLCEDLQAKISNGSVTSAQLLISDYIKPEVRVDSSIDILNDVTAIRKAFQTEEEELFILPGDLGKLTGPMCRGDFVAFLAPPKRGKTWWLMFVAMQAFMQGQQVLFISLEMTKEQMTRRFWQYVSGQSRYGETVDASAFEQISDDRWELVQGQITTQQVNDDPLYIKSVQETLKTYCQGGKLILRNYPTGLLTLNDLKAELKNLEVFENFVPTVIVVDYADIMKMGQGKEKRFQLDDLWLGLRGLNLEKQCCLFTASQSGRETVTGKKDANIDNIAEAVSKLNHVTKMIVLNQNEDDKKRSIYRLKCTTTRDGAGSYDQVVCTSCLAIGRPWMDCHFLSHVDLGNSQDDEIQQSGFRTRS